MGPCSGGHSLLLLPTLEGALSTRSGSAPHLLLLGPYVYNCLKTNTQKQKLKVAKSKVQCLGWHSWTINYKEMKQVISTRWRQLHPVPGTGKGGLV